MTIREKLATRSLLNAVTGCVDWTGSMTEKGYGIVEWDGRTWRAHRVAYVLENGPIPEGMQLDHLCRNRRCINPTHLEVVTSRENTLRGMGPSAQNAMKTHCNRGHILDGDNLYLWNRKGREPTRHCRTCKSLTKARAYNLRRQRAGLPVNVNYSRRREELSGESLA